MVASSSFEFSRRCTIRRLAAVFVERIWFSCEGVSEKKAVSEAEAVADSMSKTRMMINPAIRPMDVARSLVEKFNKTVALNAAGSGSVKVKCD